jgi:hypothetical protein
VIDNDGSHSASSREGYMALKAGYHPIEIQYFEDFLGETLQLGYRLEDATEFKPIESSLFH